MTEESQNNSKYDDTDGSYKLSQLVSKMQHRLQELLGRRQELVAELAPMDAAIHELTQMLAAAGENGSWLSGDIAVVSIDDVVVHTGFTPVKQSTVERFPVRVERRGPDSDPPYAETADDNSKDYVKSPKSGTAVPTSVATLKRAIQTKKGM